MNEEQVYSPSDFVAVFNQTIEYAYPSVLLQGELADYRVSKGRWLYFKLKDEHASVQCFGTVAQVRHKLEEGMLVQMRGYPRLHPLYNFSLQVQFLQPVGEGAIKKAADLLREKLKKEGLFDVSKKRSVPYPPKSIGLITSEESAAYHDFIKVLNARWRGVDIQLAGVQVQGEPATQQIVGAIAHFNKTRHQPEVLVITRGGGSPEDLEAFNSEPVTRAVAGSVVPTVVAVGHETDVSLAELAADMRASTPSNAAELLVPDRQDARRQLSVLAERSDAYLQAVLQKEQRYLKETKTLLAQAAAAVLRQKSNEVTYFKQLLAALHPKLPLQRGYALVWTKDKSLIRSASDFRVGDTVRIEVADAEAESLIQSVQKKRRQR